MNDKVDKIVAMMSVLPDLMARASKEPITPVEPDSYFRDYVRGEKIEKMLRYTVPSTYVLAWALKAPSQYPLRQGTPMKSRRSSRLSQSRKT